MQKEKNVTLDLVYIFKIPIQVAIYTLFAFRKHKIKNCFSQLHIIEVSVAYVSKCFYGATV